MRILHLIIIRFLVFRQIQGWQAMPFNGNYYKGPDLQQNIARWLIGTIEQVRNASSENLTHELTNLTNSADQLPRLNQ